MNDDDDLLRRLRKTLNSAENPLSPHEEAAALNAAGRLMINHSKQFLGMGPGVPLDFVDEQIRIMSAEKLELTKKVIKLEYEIVQLKQELATRKPRVIRTPLIISPVQEPLDYPDATDVWINDPNATDDIIKPKPKREKIVNPGMPRVGRPSRTVMSLAEIDAALREAIAGAEITPSEHMLDFLEQEDLHDKFVNDSNRSISAEIDSYTYDLRIYGQTMTHMQRFREIIGAKRHFLIVFNNLPKDFENERHRTMVNYGSKWLTGNASIPKWAAFVARSGNMNRQLYRLRELGWE